jgi:hypothetical protein
MFISICRRDSAAEEVVAWVEEEVDGDEAE